MITLNGNKRVTFLFGVIFIGKRKEIPINFTTVSLRGDELYFHLRIKIV